ncbi:MAG: GTPase Era [Candidatus Kapaibacterium sp.]|nr:GTPase Era [Ignavibacteriota bacterium]MCB9222037.1 GTPase Era [Ignavibacteria bacterium]
MSDQTQKAGFVAIVGMPNSGKSTLMNALMGEKLSIVTAKPQTTRKNVSAILSSENSQIIFLDTPGILRPRYEMQRSMMRFLNESLDAADVISVIWNLEKDGDNTDLLSTKFEFLKNYKAPKVLILNKIDTYKDAKGVLPVIAKFQELEIFADIIPISALKAANTDALIRIFESHLPESDFYYPTDIISTLNERFFVSELIREKIFEQLKEELPYSTEVTITQFKEREAGKWFISADIIVEKDSQKGIMIGKGGTMLKRIGAMARKDIEAHLQMPVFLELFVKVRDNWREKPNMLRSLGY